MIGKVWKLLLGVTLLAKWAEGRRLNADSKTCIFGICARASISSNCIASDTLLFSCTLQRFVRAEDFNTGDSVRTITPHGQVCSEIYFTFHHKDESPAISIAFETPEGTENVVLSPFHIMYQGETFDGRKPILAKDVRPGDLLVHLNTPKTVISVTPTTAILINILPFEPALELESGVVISAHSFHEVFYSYVFWPLQLLYKVFGRTDVDDLSGLVSKLLHPLLTSYVASSDL